MARHVHRATTLKFLGVTRNKGKCDWKICFQIDDIPFNVFFGPPPTIKEQISIRDVEVLGVPLIIDLTAQVRPKSVYIGCQSGLPSFNELFQDAVGALLDEQASFWHKSHFMKRPKLSGVWKERRNKDKKLKANDVALGFSGGKDSIVTLFSLLKSGYKVHPVLFNEGDRSWQDIRKWIPKLRSIGLKPTTAYLLSSRRKRVRKAFGDWYLSSYQIGLLVAALSIYADKVGAKKIILGIENSADSSYRHYKDKNVNHQHQKTTEHLKLLEKTFRRLINKNIEIGSPIASTTDSELLDILIHHVPGSFRQFSSCGSANWKQKNCGKCEKCAFIYALLQKSTKGKQLSRRIFNRELFDDVELYRPWLDQRYAPPLACIGSRQEVWELFEKKLKCKTKLPVIKKWESSKMRKAFLTSKCINDTQKKLSPLEEPVLAASKLVRKWVNDKNRQGVKSALDS